MNELAQALAEELVGKGINDDVQTIANYIADNQDWEGALHYNTISRGRSYTENVVDDFISDVQFYMEELREVKND